MADLADDVPRLIYADWLEEQGDTERAEFIRVQCELEPMRDRYEIDRAAELHRREDGLLSRHVEQWLGEMPWDWRNAEIGARAEFRRGFVDILSMPARMYLDLGASIRRLYPTIRRVALFRVHGHGKRLAACPALDGLAELELACWYADVDAEAIAASPYLERLQVLELWLGRRRPLRDRQLCQIMARSKAWPHLRELTLLNPDNEKERSRKRQVAVANKAAGRKIATYRRGYPELFPFAADFRDLFPGYLPDGRMALVSENHWTTSPPTLCVLTFDERGDQTDEILTVPAPADLLVIPRTRWYEHRERITQHLHDLIGFRPGFIRIRACRFPWDEAENDCPHRGHEGWWDALGLPDDDEEEPWQESLGEEGFGGNGGPIFWLLREGQYIYGWDWWADKRGNVHST